MGDWKKRVNSLGPSGSGGGMGPPGESGLADGNIRVNSPGGLAGGGGG